MDKLRELTMPKYTNSEEYKIVTGFDLGQEINDSDDPANDGNRRLKDAEELILNILNSGVYAFNESMINETNIGSFKWCICKQCEEMIYTNTNELKDSVRLKLRALGFMNVRRG